MQTLLIVVAVLCSCAVLLNADSSEFMWGTSSSSYQYEGHSLSDGKQASIWDDFCMKEKKCYGNSNANVATNQYDLKQLDADILLMKAMNTSAYRMSVAWPRIMTYLPDKEEQSKNQAGIDHYTSALELLIKREITPLVTLFHFDLPLWMEEKGGWLNPEVVDYFGIYAEACFRAYGHLVKNWMTINEPHTIATAGYMYGLAAPGRCSDRNICTKGNSTKEPYLVAHQMLLAHAKAVKIFRQLQEDGVVRADGRISLAISADWTEPWDPNCKADVIAAERRQAFQVGWFADPIRHGHYPAVMRELVGNRLPVFTLEESEMLIGSWDYFGLNHYTSRYGREARSEIREKEGCFEEKQRGHVVGASVPLVAALEEEEEEEEVEKEEEINWDTDQLVDVLTYDMENKPIGWLSQTDWLYAVPFGFHKLLVSIGKTYGTSASISSSKTLPIFVTENGVSVDDAGAYHPQPAIQKAEADTQDKDGGDNNDDGLNDKQRILYYDTYLDALQEAIFTDGIDIQAYFAWSLLDNFEWGDGFTCNFGFYRVNRPAEQEQNDGMPLERTARKSVDYFKSRIINWPNGKGK